MPWKRITSYLFFHADQLFKTTSSVKNNKSFCILPWIHMYVTPSGDCFPCCVRHPKSEALGNLNFSPIEKIWNSGSMKQFRLDLLSGKKREDTCSTCYRREEKEGNSHRLEFNKKFFHLIRTSVKEMHQDGSVDNLNWAYWDVRLSNKCNFRCRTCGPEFSTSWQSEINAGAKTKSTLNFWESGFDFLVNHGQKIEEIYFAGGEPLIIDEHYQLLEWLLAKGKNKTVLNYNSNLSELTYKNWNAIDLWKKFKFVYLSPSIDHFGKAAEYVRKGTSWSKLQKNLLNILSQPNIMVRPTMTISMLNILDFTKIHSFYMDMGLIKNVNHFAANLLYEPDFYHISCLPQHLKEKTVRELYDYNELLKTTTGDSLDCLPHIINQIMLPNSHKFEIFLMRSHELDKVRSEKLFDYFPEYSFSC